MTKTKNNPQIQVSRDPTRKQASRAEREARQRRNILLFVGAVLGLVVLIIVFGLFREEALRPKPTDPVADVNGEKILTSTFQARVRLELKQLQNQLEYAQQLGNTQTINQLQSELQQPATIGQQVLNTMVDEVLLRQAAPEFNVSVAQDEVQKSIEESLDYFRNPPTPEPTRTPRPIPTASGPVTQTATPTATPLPTATPVTEQGFQQLYQDQLANLQTFGLTEQDYRQLVETNLVDNKVREAIYSTVPTKTEQVQFKFIRVEAADVPTFTQALNKDGFDSVYQAIVSNTFPITTVLAASSASLDAVGFVPRDEISATTAFGPAIADALFNTPISQTTALLANAEGSASYIAFIEARATLPLNPQFLQTRQQQALEDWLTARRKPEFYLKWEDRVPTKP